MELAKSEGVRIVSGSDFTGAEGTPHGQNYREILNLAKYIGAREALIAATSTASQCLGLEKSGSIQKNMEANLVVVKGDPLRNIESLAPENIQYVAKDGRVYTPNSSNQTGFRSIERI